MMLKLNEVKKSYKNFNLDCSLEVRPGMVTGLIGANGAGKSTTFKAILGLIKYDGDINIFGKPVSKITLTDKENIGVVMSTGSFSSYLTIKQVIPVMEHLYSRFDKAWFKRECERFNLPLVSKIKDFSTGMKARLNVLLAMSHDAKLLILDEPTAGLDVIARDELLDMLRTYMGNNERSILISSHISSDLESLCDDLYMIHDGKIIFHNDTDVLLDEFGMLKVSSIQFKSIDKKYITYVKEEPYGYHCMTDNKQYYIDNYPNIAIEKGCIDDFMTIVEKGAKR